MSKKLNATFKQQEYYTPRNKKEKALAKAFTKIKDEKTVSALLRDLMTLSEIEEFANRLEIARLLTQGKSYQEIANLVGVSTTTVTRVAHWLFKGCGGYPKVLKKLSPL